MPGKRWVFTTRVESVSPPPNPRRPDDGAAKPRRLNQAAQNNMEAPGTAPGSTMFIPRTVYRHSRQASTSYIGAPRPVRKKFFFEKKNQKTSALGTREVAKSRL